jgi:hypothetical protein
VSATLNNNSSAARDIFVTATTGDATVGAQAFAGDDVEITATSGDVAASGATLRSTGLNAGGDAHVLADRPAGRWLSARRRPREPGGGGRRHDKRGHHRDPGNGQLDPRSDPHRRHGPDPDRRLQRRRHGLADRDGRRRHPERRRRHRRHPGGAERGGLQRHRRQPGQQAGAVQDSTLADIAFTNAQALSITDTVSGGGDIAITTTAGVVTLASDAQVVAQQDVSVTGAAGFDSIPSALGVLQGANVTVTAVTGDALVDYMFVTGGGGTGLVQALDGSATLRSVLVDGAVTHIDVMASGTATVGADSLAGITAHHSAARLSGSLDIDVASSGGDARVFLNSLDGVFNSVSANAAGGTASIGVADGFVVDTVSGFSVDLSAGNGTIDVTTLTVGGGDYTAEGLDWAGVALNPGGVIRDLSITDTGGGLALSNALTATGDLSLSSATGLSAADALVAGGDIDVTAAEDVDLVSAEAGDDITVTATGGEAILRQAVLTGAGAGRDLSVTAFDDAVLGDPDPLNITADNVFSRTGASTGAAVVKSTGGGYAVVNLDSTAKLDTLEGAGVTASIVNGAATIDTITALTDGIHVEVLDGALTLDTAAANTGDVDLYAFGDLTITGSVHGDGLVGIETDGLLDGTLASLISSNGDLGLVGGAVDVGTLQADGVIIAIAADGDIDVQSAVAGVGIQIGASGDAFVDTAEADEGVFVGAGGNVLVNSAKANGVGGLVAVLADGDATLRGAEASDGIMVFATGAGTATFGADSAALITAANYAVTAAAVNCGCLPPNPDGLQVYSEFGDAVVNLDSISNPIALVRAAADRDAMVTLKTGDLKIDELSAYNITIEAVAGTLETGLATSAGGDYRITAQDFLGDVLTPTLDVGLIHDVAITDTLGDLDLGTAFIHADRKLTIAALDGAVTGAGQLDAGSGAHDGEVDVTADAISLESVQSDGDVTLTAATGGVSLGAGGVHADRLLTITALGGAVTSLGQLDAGLGAGAHGGEAHVTANAMTLDAVQSDGDVVLTAGAGGVNLGAVVHADHTLTITALNGAVTGTGQLDAGLGAGAHDGEVNVAADAISLESVQSDGDVTLTAATGGVSLGAGGVHADRLLHLTALNGAVTSLGQLDAGLGAGAHGGEVNVTANAMTLDAVQSDGDVTLTAGAGGVALGAVVHADHTLTIAALNGAVTGTGQLDAGSGAGDGEVDVTADAIALDTVLSDGDVNLNGGTGLVNVATSLGVDGAYHLTGGDFSAAALAPQGLKAGAWSIIDQTGDFDFSGKTLAYGGSIGVTVVGGDIIGGDMTSDVGGISVAARGGHLGALYGGGGTITATGSVGGMAVESADALADVTVLATAGTASLGSAVVRGSGARTLTVVSNGDVVLGAATPGAITAGNILTSTGGSLAVVASAPTGKVDVNLDHMTNAALNTVVGLNAVKIKVVNGSQQIGFARSISGGVQIDGPTGALTVYQLTAGATSRVDGGGDTQLVSADITGDLTVRSASGNLRFGDATLGGVIDVRDILYLNAATDIAQHGALHAGVLYVTSGTGVVLLGANRVDYLDAVTVNAGGFAFHDTVAFDLYGPVNAVGQTVDLRSDQAIGQVSTGIITAQKLTGSAVGGANFGAANQVVQLGDFTNTGGLLKLVDGRSLTVNGTVLSTGTVSLASHAGLTLASTGRVQANGTGDAVVLASDGVFTNARGADAVTAANGRWLIYTQAVGNSQGSTAGNTFNGLAGKSFYGSAYDFSNETFALAPNAGNRFVYGYRPTLTATPDSRVVIYDGTVPTTSATITGLVNGDLAADAWSGAPAVSGATSKVVGTYILAASAGSLASELNYAFAYGAGSLRIDPKALGGVLTANDKTYDGTVAATGAIGLTGVVAGDAVSAAGTYAFADKTAATGKTVTASGVTLAGGDAGNYSLASVSTDTADILKKSVTGALSANDKTYDGTVVATGSIGLTGVLAGDAVSASGGYAFADRNAATDKTVTASGAVLAGADAGNYSLTSVSSALADILRRPVSVAADSLFKPFGQVEPTLTYRITVGDLAAGDAFTGALARDLGEIPGSYGITRGTLALSANYDLTFTGAVFTIRPLPSNEPGGAPALKHLNEGAEFTLDWDPAFNLTTEGQACPSDGCPSQGAASGGGKVAALR